ncbi:MAG: HAMP domain-containing protein [Planctomycetes bacterium]|nr:HAMP domain-containing protein [Planctomycetota bacterium]
MFLTRSIRRKLVIGLALVCLMLGILAIAGLTGLVSYRAVVQDLAFRQNQEPHRTELAVACAGLFEALLIRPQDRGANPFAAPVHVEMQLGFDASKWADQMALVRQELTDFRKRLDRLPTSVADRQTQAIMHTKLDNVQSLIGYMQQHVAQVQKTPGAIPDTRMLESMVRDVAVIQSIIQEIPNPSRGTEQALNQAPAIYESRMILIGACILCIPFLLIFLVRCGHFWIFVPIRKLHEAAARVANGDYKHRLKLPGRDEMVDLANVFNRMIERFQSDKAKLDREVEERSRQLLRNERLAGIGFLATGIAHEINNPLSAIAMAAESLIGRMTEAGDEFGNTADDRELLKTYLEMIQRQSNRCQEITTRVLDFSRNNTAPRQRHDLTKIVGEVLEMVSHMSRFGHHKIRFDRSRPHLVEVNAPEIQQVIINLIANGLESMESAGTMTISITESFDEVVLTVQDSGCGMTAHVLANLYEPFFTEKLPGKKGTGLGLSITNRIIADHDGRIEASSEGPGKGSTFSVHLPRRAGGVTRAA